MNKNNIIKVRKLSKNEKKTKIKNGNCNNMCMKLVEMNGMTAERLLEITGQANVFPVDVAQICFELGIRLLPFNFGPIEQRDDIKEEVGRKGNILGAVVVNRDDLAILYRESDMSNRRRFTIAHELAHCCLHMSPNEQSHIEFRTDASSEDDREIEANIFAGKLLIPEKVLIHLLGNKKFISNKSISHLSELFMVSENVMRERLKVLKIGIVS